MFKFDYTSIENIREKIKRFNLIQKCLTTITFQKKTWKKNLNVIILYKNA